jgi:hypothetical protein
MLSPLVLSNCYRLSNTARTVAYTAISINFCADTPQSPSQKSEARVCVYGRLDVLGFKVSYYFLLNTSDNTANQSYFQVTSSAVDIPFTGVPPNAIQYYNQSSYLK